MRAVIYTNYGPPEVLRLVDAEKPVPRENEIRIEVHASTVAAGDVRLRKAEPFAARLYNGLFRPRKVQTLGFELAGIVDVTGQGVTRYKEGDAVFAFTGFGFGAYAEFRCLPELTSAAEKGLVAIKPANLTFAEAAALPVGGLTALAFLRKAQLRAGQKVLIYGASGSVGTYAVQLARHFDADVSAVCSTANLAWVKSLGADRVIDYTREDFTNHAAAYDVIIDAVGKAPAARLKRLLKSSGVFLSVMSSAPLEMDDLLRLKELAEAGEIKAVIDRIYPLEEIVDAHRYVEQGHKKGNVAIAVKPEGETAQRAVLDRSFPAGAEFARQEQAA